MVVLLIPFVYFGQAGLNKTVGWAYDLCGLSMLLAYLSSLLFTLIFGIVGLLRYQTNKILSIINILLLVFSLPVTVYIHCEIALLIGLVNLAMLVINVGSSIMNRKRNNY